MKKRKKMKTLLVAGLAAGTMLVTSTSAFAADTDIRSFSAQSKSFGMHGMSHPRDGEEVIVKNQAALLGITPEELRAKIDQGKHFNQIVAELGISKEELKMRMDAQWAKRAAQLKAQIQSMVTEGKITQAQANTRIAMLENPPQRVVPSREEYSSGKKSVGKKSFGPKGEHKGMKKHPKRWMMQDAS